MQTIIGVDVGGTLLRAARFGSDLTMLERVEHPSHAEEGVDAVLDHLFKTIRRVLPQSPDGLEGIGLALPGPLDVVSGTVIATPNLPFRDLPIAALVREAVGGPVYLGNDADLAGLAEHQLGAGRGAHTMVYITVSTGVGGGVISGGKPSVGRGQGGEIGHMVVLPGGPPCGCGRRGHLEALSSGTAIARIARERLEAGQTSTIRDLVGGDLARVDARIVGQAAHDGDTLALEIIRQAGHYLGIGIASLLSILNPDIFVLGGGVTRLGDLLFEPMWEAIKTYAMHPRYWENTPIVHAELGSDVGLYGAAALVRAMRE